MRTDHMLVGKTLVGISKDPDGLRIQTLEQGAFDVSCEADCCSETWVEHLELPALGFPAKVLAVDDSGYSVGTVDDGPQDYTQVYKTVIRTDKGDIDIEYRNSSNGYYGGRLYWPSL